MVVVVLSDFPYFRRYLHFCECRLYSHRVYLLGNVIAIFCFRKHHQLVTANFIIKTFNTETKKTTRCILLILVCMAFSRTVFMYSAVFKCLKSANISHRGTLIDLSLFLKPILFLFQDNHCLLRDRWNCIHCVLKKLHTSSETVVQRWAQLSEKLASITDTLLTRKLAKPLNR